MRLLPRRLGLRVLLLRRLPRLRLRTLRLLLQQLLTAPTHAPHADAVEAGTARGDTFVGVVYMWRFLSVI